LACPRRLQLDLQSQGQEQSEPKPPPDVVLQKDAGFL
jgi:hypothetical protein